MFWKIYGLPCSHILQGVESIKISDIHSQWHLSDLSSDPMEDINVVEANISEECPWSSHIIHKLDYLNDSQKIVMMDSITRLFEQPVQELQNPIVVLNGRGRPQGALNKKRVSNSSRRDPSAFEIAEGRKCGVCKQGGHNSRTCSNKQIR